MLSYSPKKQREKIKEKTAFIEDYCKMYCQFQKNGYIGSFNAWCCCTGFRHSAHGCIKQRVQLCRVCLHHEPKVNSSWRRRKLVYFFGIMSFIKILILTVKVTNLLFLTGSGEDINSCSASLPAGTIYTVGAKQKWLHFYAELQNSELFLFHLFFFFFMRTCVSHVILKDVGIFRL